MVAADLTLSFVLQPERAARLVEQHAVDPSIPRLEAIVDRVVEATFGAATSSAYEAEVKRAIERVTVERLMTLAANARMPQVRAISVARLKRLAARLEAPPAGAEDVDGAHAALMSDDIRRFLTRPLSPLVVPTAPVIPPGAPIGEPALDWLDRFEPRCSWEPVGR